MAKAGTSNYYYIQEKDKKENSKYPSSFSLDSVSSFKIARVGVDQQKVWLHRRDLCSGCGSFHVRQQKHLTCRKPGHPHFLFFFFQSAEVISASVIRSFLPNTKAGPSLRLCRTPLVEPKRQNPRQRKSAASWSRGWCGATCTLYSRKHSHKYKHVLLREQREDTATTAHADVFIVKVLSKKMSLALLCKYFFSRTRRPTCTCMLNA